MIGPDGYVPAGMKTNTRPLFRPEAVRRYTEAKEQSVLPRFVSPRITVALWTILVLLIFSAVAVWFTSTPIYASGPAIVVDTVNKPANIIEEGMAILVLLPSEAQPALDEGKTILIQVNISSMPLQRKIVAFEKDVSKVNSILEKFDLNNHPAVAKAQPAAVAIVRLEDMRGNDYVGTIFRADIQVGSRRIASLLPLMDRIS
jgi:hypothetical protein